MIFHRTRRDITSWMTLYSIIDYSQSDITAHNLRLRYTNALYIPIQNAWNSNSKSNFSYRALLILCQNYAYTLVYIPI